MSNRIVQIWKRALKGVEFLFKRLVILLLRLFFTTGGGDTTEGPIRRILFLRFDKLGDMVSSLPVFETVSRARPEIELEVLASRSNRIFLENDSRISACWTYTKRPWQDIGMLRKLRKRNYDVIIDLICLDSVTSLFISQFTGRNVRRIGIGKKRFEKYYTEHVPLNPDGYEHIVDTTLKTLAYIGIDRSQFIGQAPLQLPGPTLERADSFIAALRDSSEPATASVIGINISAGKPNRIWKMENFVELIAKLSSTAEETIIVIFCSPNDRGRAETIQRLSGTPTHLLPDGLNILDVSALIAKLDMLITPDTSVIHIARQYNVPVVGMYPTHGRSSAQWKPYGQPDGLVEGGSACDIFDITPEQVYQEFLRVSQRIRQLVV